MGYNSRKKQESMSVYALIDKCKNWKFNEIGIFT